LKNLEGLNSFDSVGSYFFVGTSMIESLEGLENLEYVGIELNLAYNRRLKNLDALNNLKSAPHINISLNDSLTDISGLGSIDAYIRSLSIQENPSLVNLHGLESIDSVTYDIRIKNNNSLVNLSGLDNLRIIAGDYGLEISENPKMLNVDGLESLEIIRGNFTVKDNDLLASLESLLSINSVYGDIDISSNPMLALCSSEGLCNIIRNLDNGLWINNNAEGCNSSEEILAYCIEELLVQNEKQLYIYPNPTRDYLSISDPGNFGEIRIRMVDFSGYPVQSCILNGSDEIDISFLKSGIYFLELTFGDYCTVEKIIKK
jgi:hypothetical protein